MSSKLSVVVAVVVAVLLGVYAMLGQDGSGGRGSALFPPEATGTDGSAVVAEQFDGVPQEFVAEIPVLASATPAPEQRVRAVPKEVTLRFNMHLVPPSHFHIEYTANRDDVSEDSEAEDFGVGDTILSKDGLMMRRAVNPEAPDGTYRVRYRMCTLPANCATDYYFFKVES